MFPFVVIENYTLHGFILQWTDVLKAWRGNIPVKGWPPPPSFGFLGRPRPTPFSLVLVPASAPPIPASRS